ncbi:DUF4158 domain-containing protein [Alkalimarinus alittae]|uniref:DUF4158 domain-containing protein n=1 Tax=Alkalimarinus alittae TaxID=2961619 RepID=UPI0038780A42
MIAPDSAYPLLPAELTQQELSTHFSPTVTELTLANQKRQPLARLAFLAHLKLAQRLGYFLVLTDIPDILLKHLADALKLKKYPKRKEISAFEASGSRSRQLVIIRKYLGIKPFTNEKWSWLEKLSYKHAQSKESVNDIIKVMLEELVHHCYELPGLSGLQSMAQRIRTQVNDKHFQSITENLSEANKDRIKELLSKKQSEPSVVQPLASP